jgi:hypothetical protein
MGSHATLAHPNPTRDPEELSAYRAHHRPTAEAQPSRDLEQTFDRLNPEFGVPADTHNPDGQQAVRDREAALLLGTRVSVATSRENDPNPVLWLGGQDYRAADATHRARIQTIRQRYGPERPGPER